MRVLHAGCGNEHLPPEYGFGKCDEVRLDIDPTMNPDIVASIVDLGDVGEFDAVYCSHALEHLYPHQVPQALAEFRRVLKPGGYALIFVPDLEDVRPTEDVLYESNAGPVSGLDLIYGHHKFTVDRPYMAHHCGFTSLTLGRALTEAGFNEVHTRRIENFCHNLMAVAKVN